MLSGRNALAEIDTILSKARGNLTSVDVQFAAARADLARLKQTEIGIFAGLAKLRLLAIEQGGLLNALNDADQQAGDILEERRQAAAKLDQQAESARAALAANEERRVTEQAAVAAGSEALDAAEAQAQARLAADEGYKAQLVRTEETDFIADQAEDKAAAAENDRVAKGKPYEDDPLFAYLWSRGYGTSQYRASPLTRWLDRRIAKVCAYEPARRNYALLIEIPPRLKEHAARMRADFDREVEALRALEQAAAETAEVPQLKTRLEAVEKDLSAIDASITEQEDKIRGLVEEGRRFAAGEDSFYRRCIDVLSEAMQRESIQLLQERAARTLEREDDKLVRRLADLEHEADRIEQNLAEFRRLHEQESERLIKLEEVRRRFKEQRFDDPRSEFLDSALIVMVLNQFLTGAVSSGDVWDVIRRQQRNRRVHADPNFGTLRFPRAPKAGPWRMPKGGGFRRGGSVGGGGFRTGGGFKGGGGFRSGGGF